MGTNGGAPGRRTVAGYKDVTAAIQRQRLHRVIATTTKKRVPSQRAACVQFCDEAGYATRIRLERRAPTRLGVASYNDIAAYIGSHRVPVVGPTATEKGVPNQIPIKI